jgi:cell division protease FtsH
MLIRQEVAMTEEIVVEERPLNTLEDEVEESEMFDPELYAPQDWLVRQRKKLKQKNQVVINDFLGNNSRIFTTGKLPIYYGKLITWALHQYLRRKNWEIVATLGYREAEPVYGEVDTGKEKYNLLIDGQILIKKDNNRYALTVDIAKRSSIQLEGPENKKEEMTKFIDEILDISKKENIYRGKKVEFNGGIDFLAVKDKSWDSVVLDFKIKTEIKANTIGFLQQSECWIKYGIPLKRGVLLAGEPGTGKTIICKALMAEADGITCITTNAYGLNEDEYITLLYELAQDLCPCIVFIEDIDLIGQNRMEFGYQSGPALLSLLAVLDGIEEKRNIVTVATTNCLETLDKALSQRPSRFDRIIKLSVPLVEQRRELIRHICLHIPLDEEVQEYIALKTENCTPAYVQEIVYGLVIQQPATQNELRFSHDEVDYLISSITNKNRHRIGFTANGTGNENKQKHPGSNIPSQ